MNKELVVRIVVVTPEMASEWLLLNTHNRPSKPTSIRRYMRDMHSDNWDLNGESIKFDANGELRDGQNRLMACVGAQRPFTTVVVWGVAPESQETMDVGVRRSVADVLKIRGEANATYLAAAALQLGLYLADPQKVHMGGMVPTPSVRETLRILDEHPGLRNSVRAGDAVRQAIGLPGSVAGPLHYITSLIDEDDSEFFWSRLSDGVSLADDHPIYVLRKAVLNNRSKERRDRVRTRLLWAYTVKAWNAYRDGSPMRQLVYRGGGAVPERFPVPK